MAEEQTRQNFISRRNQGNIEEERQNTKFPEPFINLETLQRAQLFSLLSNCEISTLKNDMISSLQEVDVASIKSEEWPMTHMQGYAAVLNTPATPEKQTKTIVLGFRGTQNWKNVIQDCRCFHEPHVFPKCKLATVHKGFFEILMEIRKDVTSWVRNYLKNDAYIGDILVTGHSLGGAIGVLVAVILHNMIQNLFQKPGPSFNKYEKVPVVKVITFGKPRIGNFEFANYVNTMLGINNVLRVVNEGDLVPTLGWMNMGYVHEGHEIFFTAEGQRYESRDIDEETLGLEDSLLGLANGPHMLFYFHPEYRHMFYLKRHMLEKPKTKKKDANHKEEEEKSSG